MFCSSARSEANISEGAFRSLEKLENVVSDKLIRVKFPRDDATEVSSVCPSSEGMKGWWDVCGIEGGGAMPVVEK